MTVIHLKEIDSTNLYMQRNMRELPNICSLRADIQTAGRGRLHRQWASAKGGLWFSVLFKSPTHAPFQLQKICSLATLKTMNLKLQTAGKSSEAKQKCRLKWPNDIYYGSRKIAGCLQKNIISSKASTVIIGIGVNINNPLPKALDEKAISLKIILSKAIDVESFYLTILENIEQRLSNFSPEVLAADYKKNLLIKDGSLVKVLDVVNKKEYTGRVMGYPEETLDIITKEGLLFSFKAADVTLKSWDT